MKNLLNPPLTSQTKWGGTLLILVGHNETSEHHTGQKIREEAKVDVLHGLCPKGSINVSPTNGVASICFGDSGTQVKALISSLFDTSVDGSPLKEQSYIDLILD